MELANDYIDSQLILKMMLSVRSFTNCVTTQNSILFSADIHLSIHTIHA